MSAECSGSSGEAVILNHVLRRKHKRGGKTKKSKSNTLTIDFLNVRGISSKIHEFNKHILDENVDIFGCVETFLSSNNKPSKLDKNFKWVGKSRSKPASKGGIGLCIKSEIPLIDENLLKSMDDKFERLWVSTRLNDVKTAIGVAYFPNDGVSKDLTDSLMYELLCNCTDLKSLGYEVILMGDFNGKCLRQFPYTNKNIFSEQQSYNGKRLRQFIDVVDLNLVNTLNLCSGHFTRILNNQRSAIDYVFLSDGLCENVSKVLIDEQGIFNLHSDHVIIQTSFKFKQNYSKGQGTGCF